MKKLFALAAVLSCATPVIAHDFTAHEMFQHSFLVHCDGARCTNVETKEVLDPREYSTNVTGFVIMFPAGRYTPEQIAMYSLDVAGFYETVMAKVGDY